MLNQEAARRAAAIVARTITGELTTPVPPALTAFVEKMVGTARPLGVLFYGSVVRALTADDDAAAAALTEGVLDFYVIVERQSDWPRGWISRLANRLLPPNVEYHEHTINGMTLRAKVAILSLDQFRRLTRPQTRDTTIWARFSQPVRLVWVRDEPAADALLRCIIRAVGTAAHWAAELGPPQGTPEQYWTALYRETYAAELRVEKSNRSRTLIAGKDARFSQLLMASWTAEGMDASLMPDGELVPHIPQARHNAALRHWSLAQRLGRPLNVARLLKSAFTFTGGAQYLAWKIKRHSGIDVPLTPFAERHPILCAPAVLWRLARNGVFSRSSPPSS
ncbi:hypothetical protein [Acetobacter sp.]|uniref:hypothetical protein n=1 Tax=Acetobacter sp. TaxID=440 RepID=UPI0039EAB8C3